MKRRFVIAFAILVLVQWVLPGRTIWEKDQILKKGQSFKFKTEPVDPSNPFKGKYITLNFEQSSFADTVNRGLQSNDEVYVLFSHDHQGYAVIRDISAKEPQDTKAYVKARVYYISSEKDTITVHFNYPFDEYYMDEYKAPAAETIYRESTADTTSITYATVKILKGDAVIENVYIDDVPIRTLIK